MKEIKLRRINRLKYCGECQEVTEIVMHGLSGYCKNCLEKVPIKKTKLYNLDNRPKNEYGK